MDNYFCGRDDGRMEIVREFVRPDREAYVQAMWLRFLLTPSKPNPEVDGSYNLGEIGSAASKNWIRATPYSPAE